MEWILLTLVYGLLKGAREIVKKKAMGISTIMEVLLLYTAISFLFVLPSAPYAGGMELWMYGAVFVKSFAIFVAWILSFHALKSMPVSIYGLVDMSRVLINTALGAIILGEIIKPLQWVGLVLVLLGLLSLKWRKDHKEDRVTLFVFCVALASCALNAISGLLDKLLMKSMTSSQLQFWYMLFLVLLYAGYVVVTRTKIDVKKSLKNGWIWLLAWMFVVADKALFLANGYPESRLTVMTLVKQSACLVTILGGKFFFKEKNIMHKMVCAGVITLGIVIASLA